MAVSNIKTFILATCKPLICSLRQFYNDRMSYLYQEFIDCKTQLTTLLDEVQNLNNNVATIMNSGVLDISVDLLSRLQADVASLNNAVAQLQSQVNDIDPRFDADNNVTTSVNDPR